MRKAIKAAIGCAGVVVLAAGPAMADIQPSSTDAVGVGSDTVQNIANFLADGDYNGTPGLNTGAAKNRIVSFDATPDENDRAGYANGSTAGTPIKLNPTIILRAGENPVLRPNGSGSGIAALLLDPATSAAGREDITFVRSSRPPKAAEQTAAGKAGFGPANAGLTVVKIADDPLTIATAATSTANSSGTGFTTTATYAGGTTNAPAGLSIAEIKGIYNGTYKTWDSLPNAPKNSDGTDTYAGEADTIIPLLPPTGSGTHDTFLTDVFGTSSPTTLAASVLTVEENDPTAITSASNPKDAIAPFSQSRLNLYNDGYFYNPATAYPGSTSPVAPNVATQSVTATPSDGAPTSPVTNEGANGEYNDNRGLFIIVRANDVTVNKPFQPGGTQNFVQAFLTGSTAFVNSTNGQKDITDAGATPDYVVEPSGYSVG